MHTKNPRIGLERDFASCSALPLRNPIRAVSSKYLETKGGFMMHGSFSQTLPVGPNVGNTRTTWVRRWLVTHSERVEWARHSEHIPTWGYGVLNLSKCSRVLDLVPSPDGHRFIPT